MGGPKPNRHWCGNRMGCVPAGGPAGCCVWLSASRSGVRPSCACLKLWREGAPQGRHWAPQAKGVVLAARCAWLSVRHQTIPKLQAVGQAGGAGVHPKTASNGASRRCWCPSTILSMPKAHACVHLGALPRMRAPRGSATHACALGPCHACVRLGALPRMRAPFGALPRMRAPFGALPRMRAPANTPLMPPMGQYAGL